MNAETQHFNRQDFSESVSRADWAHSVRATNLNFFGPLALVCALGIMAHFVQTLLTN